MPRSLHKLAIERAKSLGFGQRPLSPYIRCLIETDVGVAKQPPPALALFQSIRERQPTVEEAKKIEALRRKATEGDKVPESEQHNQQ